jgi:hypothetical protein
MRSSNVCVPSSTTESLEKCSQTWYEPYANGGHLTAITFNILQTVTTAWREEHKCHLI